MAGLPGTPCLSSPSLSTISHLLYPLSDWQALGGAQPADAEQRAGADGIQGTLQHPIGG